MFSTLPMMESRMVVADVGTRTILANVKALIVTHSRRSLAHHCNLTNMHSSTQLSTYAMPQPPSLAHRRLRP